MRFHRNYENANKLPGEEHSVVHYDFPTRFRPAERFCELSLRYVWPGSEGEKCQPLDHSWQIRFIHSAQFIFSSNLNTQLKTFAIDFA